MKDDERLDALLRDAARTYRVPPPPPLEHIWAGIEREAFTAQAPPRRAIRWPALVAAAATLALGVGIGRWSASAPRAAAAGTNTEAVPVVSTMGGDPYHQATEEFLGRSVVLLAALPQRNGRGADDELRRQAGQLLTTTRLLLDSPVGTDPRMKGLLQDLELVLAQVARLQAPRERAEMNLITDALAERDLMPRIRSAVAGLAASEY